VAVRAEHPQIFEAVIVPHAANVVEVHIERLSSQSAKPHDWHLLVKRPALRSLILICFRFLLEAESSSAIGIPKDRGLGPPV
jgi:hypothetical protein